MKTITFLLFDRFTALDIVGPYEVLVHLPNYRIQFAAIEKGILQDPFGLKLFADYSIDEISNTDILLIPGGPGIEELFNNEKIIEWVKKLHASTEWTVAVCSGTLLLAEAGLLANKHCTTHWRHKEKLQKYNILPSNERYVQDGKILTCAGVSAGIDMALYLVSKITNDDVAKMIQLGIEYDPKPPFDYSSVTAAQKKIIENLKK